MEPGKKSRIVREAVARGDYKLALLHAKDFRIGISSEQRKKMALAYECMVHPQFYQSIGRDIEQAIAEGIKEVVKLYGQSCNKPIQAFLSIKE